MDADHLGVAGCRAVVAIDPATVRVQATGASHRELESVRKGRNERPSGRERNLLRLLGRGIAPAANVPRLRRQMKRDGPVPGKRGISGQDL